MELRSVEELMDLLHACRGARRTPHRGGKPVDVHEHALQTAALLRRSHPADKELQVAGLVHDIGLLLRPDDDSGHTDRAADAVRPLLGERVSRLVRLHSVAGRYRAMTPQEAAAFARDPLADDALTLRQADEAAHVRGLDAGVLEDWRTVLELVAARHARLGAVD
ncbi:HD domain-containing protein [Streptomyces sp. NPDC046931]|uniref:HD domain-containing protein n=1 Tax=Streptomyces sp. NPDC046931 TaxID=3154806 RepID=UPI0033E9F648